MPTDPDQSTPTHRHGDTDVAAAHLAEIQRLDAVIRRLTRQRDELADLVADAVANVTTRHGNSADETARRLQEAERIYLRRQAILRGEA